MSAGVAATGARAVLGSHSYGWLTPARRRRLNGGIVAAGLMAAALVGPTSF